jgi:superfamily II DNA helicase RecQ
MQSMTDALSALRQHFGFDDFREGQREVIAAILGGKDAVVVMPTADRADERPGRLTESA